MRNILLVLILLFIRAALFCELLEVDIEGNHEYTSIQSAIEDADDNDTILVYPGEYIENVDFSGKTIVLGSLYLTTGSRDYIRSTVINGNQESSCVITMNGEGEGTVLCGFTLINGSGWQSYPFSFATGGGIIIYESSLLIDNCVIEDNYTEKGGGISIYNDSIVNLKGCTIRNNHSSFMGGGFHYKMAIVRSHSTKRINVVYIIIMPGLEVISAVDTTRVLLM